MRRRLGIGQHFFAVDYLRALAGLALERRDLDTAEHLTEQALSISEQRWPLFEFLALLDRAADLGRPRAGPRRADQHRDGTPGPDPGPARRCWPAPMNWRGCCGYRSATCAPPASSRAVCPLRRRALLLARIALAAGNHHAASSTCSRRWAN